MIYKNKEIVAMSIIDIEEKKIVIISVYNRGSWKNLEEKLKRILGDMEIIIDGGEEIVIDGDFNVRSKC